MAEVRQSTFVIIREDRPEDPKTVVSDGLRIGRLPDADVWLNHPKVSRLHAGISEIEGYFFLINLSASNPTTLNGRVVPFNEAEALSAGDEIQIGHFFLQIEHIDLTNEILQLKVAQEFACDVGDREPTHKREAFQRQSQQLNRATAPLKVPTGSLDPSATQIRSGEVPEVANVLKVFWQKRTREKAARPSPLHPRTPPRPGNMRFNWKPTRDLIRPWPLAIFVWAIIAVGTFSAIAAFAHRETFAPAPISDPHLRNHFALTPPIAMRANSGECTSCHAIGVNIANRDKMNSNCANCHQTENFVATVIPAHRAAGITCTNCHAEHRGKEFRPLNAALESCAKCHNDQNKRLFNGKSVHTPHGGTFGYPVTDAVWTWKGLDAEELEQKPELKAFLERNKVDPSQSQAWRNAQFHGIHLNHIRVVPGVEGVADPDGNTVLSCSSCHNKSYMGVNVDRAHPRTTCGKCHNAEVFQEPTSASLKAQTPSCTSCHVQHVKDAHWAASLRIKGANRTR